MIAKPVAFIAAAIALVGSLWFTFKPQRTELQAHAPPVVGPIPAAATTAHASTPAQSPLASSPGNRVFELGLKNGRLVSGPAVLQVKAGDRVTLKIASNNSDELHVHGYDLRLRLKPEEVVTLDFTANRTGRFGLELHRAHAEVGALEVYPQ